MYIYPFIINNDELIQAFNESSMGGVESYLEVSYSQQLRYNAEVQNYIINSHIGIVNVDSLVGKHFN